MYRFLAALTLSTLALAALPAGATDIEPTFRTERTYFECQDQTVKVNNVQEAQGTTATWSTTAPTAPFAGEGAGCASAESTLTGPRQYDTYFRGTFSGNLDTLTVLVHDLSQRPNTLATAADLIVGLWVDGAGIVTDAGVTPEGIEDNSGVTYAYSFSIRNIGIAEEDGDGTIEREYELQIRSRDAQIFAWGADEVPSGITFNPAALAAARINA